MSDTPETDRMEASLETGNFVKRVAKAMQFARDLERRLSRVTAERDGAIKDLLELTGLAEEVRHLAKVEGKSEA